MFQRATAPPVVAGARYELPDLAYDYAALEPAISGEVLELHHAKHHAAYVRGSNEMLERLAEARATEAYASLVGLEKTLAFNLSGRVQCARRRPAKAVEDCTRRFTLAMAQGLPS